MRIFGAALLALMVVSAAPAQANMSGAFGNTVLSRYAHGGWVKHWFEADGSYRAQFSSGRTISARWRIEGDKICLNGIRPAIMMIDRFCTPMIEANIGDTWPGRDPLGRRVMNELVRGR